MSLNDKLLEQLFLIEVLVHKVNLKSTRLCDPDCTCKYSKSKHQPLRVRVKFFNFPCIEINQEEFGKVDQEMKNTGSFSSGKSFLFPMAPFDLIRAISHFPLALTVIRKPKASAPPEILGVTRVQLTDEMCDTIRRTSVCEEQLPICSTIKDAFDLVNLEGEYVGYIVLFVRLSCFGQSIVTKFQLMDKRSYLFKNTRPDEPYFCDKCEDIMYEDPQAYDVLPITPMVSTSQTVIDQPCCEDVQVLRGEEKRPVPWKMANACDCYVDKEDNNSFLDMVSDKHSTQNGDELSCSCIRQPRERKETTPTVQNILGRRSIPPPMTEHQEKLNPQLIEKNHSFQDDVAERPPLMSFDEYSSRPPHPPVRYDTTSALSPAVEGRPGPKFELEPTKDNINPPVRYDTTGALSPAFKGIDPSAPRPQTSPGALQHAPFNAPDFLPTATTKKRIKPLKPLVCTENNPETVNQQPMPSIAWPNYERKLSKMRRFKPSRKYVYSWGTRYPGVKFGHKTCVEPFINVPQQKGWLWSTQKCSYGLKPRRGWRPGAIGHSLSHLVRAAPQAVPPLTKPLEPHVRAPPSHGSVKKHLGSVGSKTSTGPPLMSTLAEYPSEESIPPVPTLHIHRRNGDYYVSMHPLGLSGATDNIPLQFKIPCKKKRIKKGEEEVLSTTSSELEIELFSPGAIEPKKEKPQRMHHETQYYEADLPTLPGDIAVTPSDPEPGEQKKGKGKRKGKSGKGGKKGQVNNGVEDLESRSKETQVITTDMDGGKGHPGQKGPIPLKKPVSEAPRAIAWEQDDQPTAVSTMKGKR